MKKLVAVMVAAVFAGALITSIVEARSSYLANFNGQYGTANTRLDTCDTCHVSGGNTRNLFGLDQEVKILAGYSDSQALTAIESLDSDSDSFSNITEINNLNFPGDLNDKPGAAPAPNFNLNPTTLTWGTTVAVGTSATKTTQIQNTGNAGLDITAIAPDSSTSAEYTWSPAAPFTIAAGSSTTLSVTYTPLDYNFDRGTLEISSNDPDTPTAALSVSGGGAISPTAAVDIDITGVSATGRISLGRVQPATVTLTVFNPKNFSSGTGLASATLVGVVNGVQVYSQTLALNYIAAGATASYTFPSYTPTTIGNINWTVSVSDRDSDVDAATAVTKIVK